MSAILKQIIAQLPKLSFSEKLTLLRLVSLELSNINGSSNVPQSTALPTTTALPTSGSVMAESESEAESEVTTPEHQKKASGGTMAWMSFVKHCQTAQPTRFTDSKDRGHVLSVAKAIRQEDEASYKTFVENWKEEHSDDEEAAPKLKKVKKVKAVKEVKEVKEKRPVHPGTAAFSAYAKKMIENKPDLFKDIKNYGEKLKIVSDIRKGDEDSYAIFVADWTAGQKLSAAVNYLKASPPFVGGGGSSSAAAQ